MFIDHLEGWWDEPGLIRAKFILSGIFLAARTRLKRVFSSMWKTVVPKWKPISTELSSKEVMVIATH